MDFGHLIVAFPEEKPDSNDEEVGDQSDNTNGPAEDRQPLAIEQVSSRRDAVSFGRADLDVRGVIAVVKLSKLSVGGSQVWLVGIAERRTGKNGVRSWEEL